MKKVYLATGWENTEHRLYFKKENALADFEEMVQVGLADKDLDVDEDYVYEEEGEEIFCMRFAKDLISNELLWACVSTVEFEDEE